MCTCNYSCVSLSMCVSKSLSLCLISESWCGLGVGNWCSNSCSPMALILGMLEALSVPHEKASILGCYGGLPRLSQFALLNGRWFEISGYVWLLWRFLWELVCAFVCPALSVSSNSWETCVINRDQHKGQEFFITNAVTQIFLRLHPFILSPIFF